ncbi:MAG: ABC transporter substrate-binding protein, partial [Rhodospirillaceae bacterium]
LAVELIAPADPNAPPKLVAAKEADIALTYQPQLHFWPRAACRSCASAPSSRRRSTPWWC